MTDRDPIRTIERRQRRDIRTLYDAFADAMENAVARVSRQKPPGSPITEADRAIIMREVDDALAVIWGRVPGDPEGAVRQIVLRDARNAQMVPLDEAVSRWRREMPRSLREAVEEDARRGR